MVHASKNGIGVLKKNIPLNEIRDCLAIADEENFATAKYILDLGLLDDRQAIEPLFSRSDNTSRRLLLMVLHRGRIKLQPKDVTKLFETFKSETFDAQHLDLFIKAVCNVFPRLKDRHVVSWFEHPSPAMAKALNFLHFHERPIPGFKQDQRIKFGVIPGARLVFNTVRAPGYKVMTMVSIEDYEKHIKLTVGGKQPLKYIAQEEATLMLQIMSSFEVPDSEKASASFNAERTVGYMRILTQELIKDQDVTPILQIRPLGGRASLTL